MGNSRTIYLASISRKLNLRANNTKEALLWLRLLLKCIPPPALTSIFEPTLTGTRSSATTQPQSIEATTKTVKKRKDIPTPDNGESEINVHGYKKRGRLNTKWQVRYFALWNLQLLYYFRFSRM